MASAVLDSSAVLAVLNAEPGCDTIIALLDDAILCSVNYAEVVSKIVERGASLGEAEAAMRLITSAVIDFDIDLARRTGALRAETMKRRTGALRAETMKNGLSLGDRACLSLAEREAVPAITGDRSWVDSVQGIEIRLFR
jgi:PIN domain nuclease of toxin-antitoxin system